MKKILNVLWASAALVLAGSCSFDHDEIIVYPNPIFETSGMQRVTTNAIYADYETIVKIARTTGLSQEVTLNISVDPSLIDEYNTVYDTDYFLLDPAFYSVPQSLTLKPTDKTADLPVIFHPDRIVGSVGLDGSSRCMLPIRISGSSVTTSDGGTSAYALLTLDVETPQIRVEGPQTTPSLSFIAGIPIPQTLVMSATTNFTTLDVTHVFYRVHPELVDSFNAEHAAEGITYQLLPEEGYSFAEEVFDPETLRVTTEITFDCSEIGGEGDVYVLPIEFVQSASEYEIEGKVYYVVVSMSEMKIMMVKGDQLETTATGRGTLAVTLNAPLTEDQQVNLIYDPAKVAAYNAANGTDYAPIDPSKVVVTATTIPAGEMTCDVQYTVDIIEIPYDAEKYLVPLSIDESALLEGTQIPEGSSTVYLEIDKTLVGDYFMECPYPSALKGTQDNSSQMNNFIAFANGAGIYGQMYYFNYNSGWSDGKVYFDISDEPMPGHENCVRLVNFLDRTGPENWNDPIPANESYLNLVTGEIVIDFIIESYWAPAPDGSDPDQIKGELRCVRLYR